MRGAMYKSRDGQFAIICKAIRDGLVWGDVVKEGGRWLKGPERYVTTVNSHGMEMVSPQELAQRRAYKHQQRKTAATKQADEERRSGDLQRGQQLRQQQRLCPDCGAPGQIQGVKCPNCERHYSFKEWLIFWGEPSSNQ